MCRYIRVFFLALLLCACSNSVKFIGHDGKIHDLYKDNGPVVYYEGSYLDISNLENLNVKVDNQSLENKLLFGYQGWFSTVHGQYSSWKHWSSDDDIFSSPIPSNASFDFWPDPSEYTFKYRIPVQDSFVLSSRGEPVYLFSNEDFQTVDTHFRWMQEHNLDGVFHLRFVSPISNPSSDIFLFKNKVLENIKVAAEKRGRVFAIRYNITDPSSARHPNGNVLNEFEVISNDWKRLVDSGVTNSSAYLHHDNLPVVSVYGIGFNKKMTTASFIQQRKLLEFFTSNPNREYRAFVVAGVPTRWRDSGHSDYVSKSISEDGGDAARSTISEPFIDLYDKRYMGAIHPWHVGRFNNDSLESFYSSVIIPDANEANTRGLLYIPTLWPGFSWAHLEKQTAKSHWNFVPRDGGNFYWRQALLFASNNNVNAFFSANFDEVDEGTAMFKQIATSMDLPDPKNTSYMDPYGGFIPLNIDGYEIPNDFFLTLANYASRILKNRNLISYKDQMIPNIPLLKSISYSDITDSKCKDVKPESEKNVTLFLEVENPFNEYNKDIINSGGYSISGIKRSNGSEVYPSRVSYSNQGVISVTFSIKNVLPGIYPIRVKSYINYSPYVLLIINQSSQNCSDRGFSR